MPSIVDILRGAGQAAGVAGQFTQGYAQDQSVNAARVLAQAKAAEAAQRNAVLNRVSLARIDPSIQGQIAGAKASGETGALVERAGQMAPIETQKAVSTAQQLAPIETQKAVAIKSGEAPIEVATHRANRVTDLQTEPDKVVGGMGPDGKPMFARVGQTGPAQPIEGLSPKPSGGGAMAAPIAAKVGQYGEMLKKAHDLTSLTDNMNVSVGESGTRDLAEHGFHVPLLGTVPGSKGLGNAMMNHSPEYAQYQAALSPFILAAAHALSGARINQDQVEQIRKSIELAPGDFANKNVRDQKEKNMIDLINSIGGSLPSEAVTAQEGQMDENALSGLAARGYRRVSGAKSAPTASAPRATSGAGKSVVVNGKTFVLPP